MQARTLICLATLANLLLSYLMLLYHQPINIDGVLYLHAAEAYLQHGFHGALNIYPWPFYSVLIAKTSTLLDLSLLNTGFILNGFFSSILVLFFLLILKISHPYSKILLWGAAVILLFPELNHDRYNILRDIPYYGLFIASLWCYIKFLQTEKISYGVAWQIILIVATLFRIEGIVFLIITPFITTRFSNFLKLSWLNILLFLITVILLGHSLGFGRIPELMADMNIAQLFSTLQNKALALKSFLGVTGQDASGIFLISGLIGILITSFITTLGIFSSLLLGYGIYKKLLPEDNAARRGIVAYIFINLIILSFFLLHQLFMNWRYVFPLVLVCLLFLPHILTTLNKAWIGVVYLICMAASSFGQFGPSNRYLVDAGDWIADNTPVTAKIYSNSALLAFYAQRTQINDPNKADYVVIQHEIGSPTRLPARQSLVVEFHNHQGDTAYIYSPPSKK